MSNPNKYKHPEETGLIIKCFYQVYNGLGVGFSKKAYIHALIHDLRKEAFTCEVNKYIDLYYDRIDIGDFLSDIVVNNKILVSIETDKQIDPLKGQVLYNQLRSSRYEVGLLLNFGISPEQIRKQFDNEQKHNLS
jgi:GxxExxY protein